MRVVTQKASAWISQYSLISPEDLQGNFAVHALSFFESGLDYTSSGYTYAGEAELTVTLVDTDTLINNKVSALREELKTVRAEAHRKSVEIEDKIGKLLAITYEPSDGAA